MGFRALRVVGTALGAVDPLAPGHRHLAVDHQHGHHDRHVSAGALLQNTQKRADEAMQHKLNGVADGLADLMEALAEEHPQLSVDSSELRQAAGLEDRESTA
jgi:hypothetical protein